MNYSIKEIANLCGIKAHTIRIWEQRYKILDPNRTNTNIRRYTEDDLKKILNVATLNKSGKKISHIARLAPDAIREEVLMLQQESRDVSIVMDRMVIAVLDLDEVKFEKIIDELLELVSFEDLVILYLFPFLEHIGVLWQTGSISPAQEHFVSHFIRSRIISATNTLGSVDTKEKHRFLLFLREGELHEIGILFANYLLRKAGLKTIFLGQSVPLNDLESVYNTYKPEYLLVAFINSAIEPKSDVYLQVIRDKYTNVKIFVVGNNNIEYKELNQVTFYESYKDLKTFIQDLVSE